jgi:hypothetical protein
MRASPPPPHLHLFACIVPVFPGRRGAFKILFPVASGAVGIAEGWEETASFTIRLSAGPPLAQG